MNPKDGERWKSQVLDEIFVALAASRQLDEALVFKGARVLNLRLGNGRQSLDLDSNLTAPFVQKYPDREAQRVFLEREITRTVRRHFERQDPVRYELTAINVKTYPPNSHPMGWDAFKVKKPGEAVRAKDLYDVSRIRSVHGLEQVEFWQLAGQEFRVACRSRYIDCQGLTTFQEQWAVTRKTYEEATIPKDISFEEAEATLVAIVSFLEAQSIVPFTFPLPEGSAG